MEGHHCEQCRQLKKQIKQKNIEIDKLHRINKANNVAAMDDVKKLQSLVNDQKTIIDNFRLLLKIGQIH